jgi:hypothetical protein
VVVTLKSKSHYWMKQKVYKMFFSISQWYVFEPCIFLPYSPVIESIQPGSNVGDRQDNCIRIGILVN